MLSFFNNNKGRHGGKTWRHGGMAAWRQSLAAWRHGGMAAKLGGTAAKSCGMAAQLAAQQRRRRHNLQQALPPAADLGGWRPMSKRMRAWASKRLERQQGRGGGGDTAIAVLDASETTPAAFFADFVARRVPVKVTGVPFGGGGGVEARPSSLDT